MPAAPRQMRCADTSLAAPAEPEDDPKIKLPDEDTAAVDDLRRRVHAAAILAEAAADVNSPLLAAADTRVRLGRPAEGAVPPDSPCLLLQHGVGAGHAVPVGLLEALPEAHSMSRGCCQSLMACMVC